MHSLSLLQEICDFFNLGIISKSNYLGPSGNYNYDITTSDGSSFIIKIIKEHNDNLQDVYDEQTYLKYLALHKINVLTYIANQDGEIIYRSNARFNAVVRQKIEGVTLDAVVVTHEHLTVLGQTMAQLHSIPIKHILPQKNHWLSKTKLEEYLSCVKDKIDSRDPLVEAAHEFKKINWSRYPQTIIHGDCWGPNIVINKQQMSLIDWEEVAVFAAILDIARTFVYLSELAKIEDSHLYSYLAGYESIRKLTDLEKTDLPHAVNYCGGTIALWRTNYSPISHDFSDNVWKARGLHHWKIPSKP